MEMMLPVELTDVEKLERSQTMTGLILKAVEVEEEQKASSAKFRGTLKDLGNRVRLLAGEVNSGKADNKVECEVVKDHGRNVVETIRTDTGAVVVTRAMDETDRQTDLNLAADVEKGIAKMEEVEASEAESGDGEDTEPEDTDGTEPGSDDEPKAEDTDGPGSNDEQSNFPGGIGDDPTPPETGLPG